jgi:hypothetical protein
VNVPESLDILGFDLMVRGTLLNGKIQRFFLVIEFQSSGVLVERQHLVEFHGRGFGKMFAK